MVLNVDFLSNDVDFYNDNKDNEDKEDNKDDHKSV